MKYRKLRIAWSIACSILCLLLIALWVRSSKHVDWIYLRVWSNRVFAAGAFDSTCYFSMMEDVNLPNWSTQHTFLNGYLLMAMNHIIDRGTTFQLGPVLRFINFPAPAVVVHIGLVTAIFAGAGIVPWLRRIPWRFSLRTLLIGMTVAAIGLGWIVYALK